MQGNATPSDPMAPSIDMRHQHLYNILAWICFGLGLVGIAVPLMPTTIFWIGAAWLWLRSRPHRVGFLVQHPRFGEPIRRFLERGEIGRTGKTASIAGMFASLLLWILVLQPSWPLALLAIATLGLIAAWIAARPEGWRGKRGDVEPHLDPGDWTRPRPLPNPPANTQG